MRCGRNSKKPLWQTQRAAPRAGHGLCQDTQALVAAGSSPASGKNHRAATTLV